MTKREDEPLIAYDGNKNVAEVIDLADVRIRWGLPKNRHEKCPHHHLVYSGDNERRIWCEDCERTIEPYDAFMVLARRIQDMLTEIRLKRYKVDEGLKATLVRRAAKAIDRIWSAKMVPCCPQCGGGLFPEDFQNGASASMGRDYAEKRRRKWAEDKNSNKPTAPSS